MGYGGGRADGGRGWREGHGLFGGAFQIASRETLASNGLVHDALLHEFQEIFAGRGLEELPSPVAYANDRKVCGAGSPPAAAPDRQTPVLHRPASGTIIRVGSSLLERKIEKRPDKVRLQGRILFLTEDPELIKKQLAGWDLPWDTKNPANNPKLRDDISTDEITPAHYCFYFDRTLGEIPYVGLRCGDTLPIGRGNVKKGGFVCSVSGKRRGKGSSREQSPYAEMCAGIQVAIAENIERIYKQNCQNLGLLTSTNFSLIDRIRAGEEIALSEFTAGEDEITRQVIEYGGLFPFNVARMQGKVFLPPIKAADKSVRRTRAMTSRRRSLRGTWSLPKARSALQRSSPATPASFRRSAFQP